MSIFVLPYQRTDGYTYWADEIIFMESELSLEEVQAQINDKVSDKYLSMCESADAAGYPITYDVLRDNAAVISEQFVALDNLMDTEGTLYPSPVMTLDDYLKDEIKPFNI